MTTLTVVVEELLARSGIGRYTEELTRALIATAPRGVAVDAFVSASTEEEYQQIAEKLPGLAALHKSALAQRELRAAWQHGFTRIPGDGMLHAPSMLAPLRRHDKLNDGAQVVVTLHDLVAWTHPESLSPRQVSWMKGMLKRAERYADAIVVPSHSTAQRLGEFASFGDRIRVIGGAPSEALARPADADERAARLGLPDRYVVAVGDLTPRRGIDRLVGAMRHVDVPLLLVGVEPDDERLAELTADLPEGRVRAMGVVSDPDLAVLLDRALALVQPSLEEGFGLPMVEAFALATPVIHSDAAALSEVSADSGIEVALGLVDGVPDDGYESRLADAIQGLLDDGTLAERLGFIGLDRSRAFSWRNSAEKVWQLHADL